MISQIDENNYLNIFKNYFLNKFGLTTQTILDCIPVINKLNFNNEILSYNLLNISNDDYFIYSHNAFKLLNVSDTNMDRINFNTATNIQLLTPVYNNYNAANKISNNLIEAEAAKKREFYHKHEKNAACKSGIAS